MNEQRTESEAPEPQELSESELEEAHGGGRTSGGQPAWMEGYHGTSSASLYTPEQIAMKEAAMAAAAPIDPSES